MSKDRTVATSTGWIASALLVLAAAVPIGKRWIHRRRAAPGSRALAWHGVLGVTAALAALAHASSILPALGDASVVRGGTAALLPGVLAVFLLVAHVGLGLRLRQPRLPDRARLRRAHVIVAATIACAVSAHVVALH